MYACEQGNLCRLVSTYAFLRREIWTERKNERVKHRRSEAKPDSYIGHDCLAAKFFHGQVVDFERAKRDAKRKRKIHQAVPSVLLQYERGAWGGVSDWMWSFSWSYGLQNWTPYQHMFLQNSTSIKTM